MKIKKLYLTSFGKFSDYNLTFDSGVNIIYGLNEAGKSTIHKFIEGMLFGFFKTGVTRRIMNEHYDQYQPRTRSEYLGSMAIEFKGKEYLIERNFSKENPSVKISELLTGKDITQDLTLNSATKLPDLAVFLEIDYTMYVNTISVSQMQNETSKDLSGVVVEKLTNLNTTKDETISVSKIIDEIEKEKKKIGTIRMKTRPLYKTHEKLKELKEELEESKLEYEKLRELQVKDSALLEEKKHINKLLDQLEKQKKVYENEKLKDKYKAVKTLFDEQSDLKKKTKNLEQYSKLKSDDYNQGVLLTSKKDEINKHIQEQSLEISSLEEKQDILKTDLNQHTYLSSHDINYYDLNDIYQKYSSEEKELEKLKKEKKRLSNSHEESIDLKNIKEDFISFKENNKYNYEQKIDDLKDRIRQCKREMENLQNNLPNPSVKILYYILIIFIIGVFLLISHNSKTSNIQKQIDKRREELNALEDELNSNQLNLSKQTDFNKRIFTQYNVASEIEFEMLYTENSSSIRMVEVNKQRLLEIDECLPELYKSYQIHKERLEYYLQNIIQTKEINEGNMKKIKEVIDDYNFTVKEYSDNKNILDLLKTKNQNLKDDLKKNIDNINEILKTNQVENFELFKKGLEKKEKYKSNVIGIENLQQRIDDYLDNESVSDLEARIDFDNTTPFDEEVFKSLKDKEKVLVEKNNEIDFSRASISENIKYIENDNREIPLINHDIDIANKKFNQLKSRMASLELVKTTLENLSEEISYEFAPTLNNEISSLINKITEGKYSDVKLDKNLDVKVFDSVTNRIESIHGFSQGTIDQLYLAMRIGINKSISTNCNPFIFDDSFVNYDDIRISNVIEIVAQEANDEDRQIILFSCQKRENKVIKNLDVNVNSINI